MKKFFLLPGLMMIFFSVKANNDHITHFFNKYASNPDFTFINITTNLFDLFADIESEDEDTKKLSKALSKLNHLKILASDSISNPQAYYKEISGIIASDSYEDLAFIKNAKEQIRFMVKEKNNKINELLMVVSGKTNFFFLNLVGEIDLENIPILSKLNIKGMNYLQHMEKDK